ncbi:hypothetical protein P3G55_19320 [Leptospira sp. 96542]|nr:hypothetical protein [Leptospira sp. 96542]
MSKVVVKYICLWGLLVLPELSFALVNENVCSKFHVGKFSYEGSFGEIIFMRSKTEEINYRVYPTSYIRTSIKWVSPCTMEQKVMEVHDEIFPLQKVSKMIASKSTLYLTEVFSDGYSFKLVDSSGVTTGRVKIYTKPLK